MGKKVLVNGSGTIGLPVIQALLHFKKELDIDGVYYHKFSPVEKHLGMMMRLKKAGAKLVVLDNRYSEFVRLLTRLQFSMFAPVRTYESALAIVDAVIDCARDGEGSKNRSEYERHENISVVIAQGSETDFGFPYAYGHNDKELATHQGKFIWVMSCNVHAMLAIINALTLGYEVKKLETIESIRFHLDRRGADVVNEKTIVTHKIGTPSDIFWGTHHARDAVELLKTKNCIQLDIHARADRSPQPFMHLLETRVRFSAPVTKEEILARFGQCILTGITYHQDIGGIYTEGKDWGFVGRINLQSVLSVPSLEVLRGGREIVFECVTPQDGNPIASSLAALARYLKPDDWRSFMETHYHPLFQKFKIV